ncbi:MAG: hypothetical protein LBQ12_14625, partial [Deltaproteobacteria bacterium]|nr:hypothetical protein [Deltaproteobacteria bacterium]
VRVLLILSQIHSKQWGAPHNFTAGQGFSGETEFTPPRNLIILEMHQTAVWRRFERRRSPVETVAK